MKRRNRALPGALLGCLCAAAFACSSVTHYEGRLGADAVPSDEIEDTGGDPEDAPLPTWPEEDTSAPLPDTSWSTPDTWWSGPDAPPALPDSSASDSAPPWDAKPPPPDGFVSDTSTPGPRLDMMRVQIPCGATIDAVDCWTSGTVVTTSRLLSGGEAGAFYDVTVRVRGVVEPNTYSGGANDGASFQVGGTPSATGYNRYSITTSSPAATYYLNRATALAPYCVALDYLARIRVANGGIVRLSAYPVDTQQHMNKSAAGAPIVVPDIPPAPSPYPGQFVQVDALSIVKVP